MRNGNSKEKLWLQNWLWKWDFLASCNSISITFKYLEMINNEASISIRKTVRRKGTVSASWLLMPVYKSARQCVLHLREILFYIVEWNVINIAVCNEDILMSHEHVDNQYRQFRCNFYQFPYYFRDVDE